MTRRVAIRVAQAEAVRLDRQEDPDAPEPAEAVRVHDGRRPERVVVRREGA